MLSFYLIIFNFFKVISKNKKIKILTFIVELTICYIIYSTQSRIGSLFLLIYFLYIIYNYKLHKNFLFLSIFIFILLFLNLSTIKTFPYNKSNFEHKINSESRNILNIDVITSRYQNIVSPLKKVSCSSIQERITTAYIWNDSCYIENNLLTVINISEPTGFIRIIHNYLSLKASIENNFLGHGLGSYSVLWYQHAKKFNVANLIKLNEVMSQWYPEIEKKKQYVQNYFFSMLHDGGILPVILILILIFKSLINVIKNNYVFGYVIFFYVIITFFFQSTITSPYPWLALAIILSKKQKYA